MIDLNVAVTVTVVFGDGRGKGGGVDGTEIGIGVLQLSEPVLQGCTALS